VPDDPARVVVHQDGPRLLAEDQSRHVHDDRAWPARERHRAIVDLSQLSDHQLRDIGISRTEIDHVVQHGRDRFL